MNNYYLDELVSLIEKWGDDKGITGTNAQGTLLAQLEKTQEELTETRDAAVLFVHHTEATAPSSINHLRALAEIEDGIGDCVVTLILAARLAGVDFRAAVNAAYTVISKRQGRMVDGKFVKNA